MSVGSKEWEDKGSVRVSVCGRVSRNETTKRGVEGLGTGLNAGSHDSPRVWVRFNRPSQYLTVRPVVGLVRPRKSFKFLHGVVGAEPHFLPDRGWGRRSGTHPVRPTQERPVLQ